MPSPLDARLHAIYSAVRKGKVAADIGTDHGYLIAELVKNGKCPKGYACDINEMPLQKAQAYIKRLKLNKKIETVLTNGIEGLPVDEIDEFIIAGMGGDLIWNIISKVDTSLLKDKHFVLQPMTKASYLRKTLCENGFAIKDETAVESGKFIYTVMSVTYSGTPIPCSLLFEHIGKLINKKDDASLSYLKMIADRVGKIADGMRKSENNLSDEALKYVQLKKDILGRVENE